MLLAFLVLLVVAMSIGHHLLPNDLIGAAVMSPVLFYSIWFYLDFNMTGLLSLAGFIATGLILGTILFAAGLLICSENPKQYLHNAFAGARRPDLALNNMHALGYQALVISYEELIWRVFLITALQTWMPAWAAVLLAAILFWLAHKENFPIAYHSVEFLLFSIIISVAYMLTGSVLLIWFIHASRNFLIMSNSWYAHAQQRD